jgi:hypothetical protein
MMPAVAAALCAVFAILLLRQWLARRRPYLLVWAAGMLWYGAAAGADAAGQLVGWTEPAYRLWYLGGAIAAAAWLGLGEVYLLRSAGFNELVALGVFAGAAPAIFRGGRLLGAHQDALAGAAIAVGIAGIVAAGVLALVSWERPQWFGHATALVVLAGTAYAGAQVLTAPVDPALMVDPQTGIPHGAAFPESVRLMTPMFNIAGALALLSGAVYSGWQFWRRGAGAERLLSTCLIALGAFAPSLGGSLNRFGVTGVFYWGELLGVLLIFAGFLASSDVFSPARRAGRRRGRYHAAVDGPQPHPGTRPGGRLPAGDRPLPP